jgi:predicted ATPase
MERNGPSVWARDAGGRRTLVEDSLLSSESALSSLRGGFREVDAARLALSDWRFYHGFRTDAEAPLRRSAHAITAPLLAADGANLAAVFATLVHIRGDTGDLDEAIDLAFPGAKLAVPLPGETASFALHFAELPNHPFGPRELSDGTLQFLALMGALLSYRLPPLIALNEPETSLHPDLLPALARIIARAAKRAQVWVVTHSTALADAIAAETGVLARNVVRREGGTWIEGLSQIGTFRDD